jgi:hypothetical protein
MVYGGLQGFGLLAMWLPEHRHSLKENLQDISKLVQHTYESHRVGWDEARIL